jgi:hypothetical protein
MEGSKLEKGIDAMINAAIKPEHRIKIWIVEVNYSATPYNCDPTSMVYVTTTQLEDMIKYLSAKFPNYKIHHDNKFIYISTGYKYEYDNNPIRMEHILNSREIYQDRLNSKKEEAVTAMMKVYIDAMQSTAALHPYRTGIQVNFLHTESDHEFLKQKDTKRRYTQPVFDLLTERLREKFPEFTIECFISNPERHVMSVVVRWEEGGQLTVRDYFMT